MRYLLIFALLLPCVAGFDISPPIIELGHIIENSTYMAPILLANPTDQDMHVMISGECVQPTHFPLVPLSDHLFTLQLEAPSGARDGVQTCEIHLRGVQSGFVTQIILPVQYQITKTELHNLSLAAHVTNGEVGTELVGNLTIQNRGNVEESGCVDVNGSCILVSVKPLETVSVPFTVHADSLGTHQMNITYGGASTQVTYRVVPVGSLSTSFELFGEIACDGDPGIEMIIANTGMSGGLLILEETTTRVTRSVRSLSKSKTQFFLPLPDCPMHAHVIGTLNGVQHRVVLKRNKPRIAHYTIMALVSLGALGYIVRRSIGCRDRGSRNRQRSL